jgi:biopolymer transport protein ExbD
MNLRSRRLEEPELILVPMIDVVLVLLIFFMITTTFRKEAELQIDLPQASSQALPVERDQLEVSIDAEGHYSVNSKALASSDIETLKKVLSEMAGDRRDQPFVIRAAGKTPHQAVVTAMDAAGQLGFRHLAIATIQQDAGQGNSTSSK